MAWVFDGTDPDGRPLIRRSPVEPSEWDAVANYLQGAPMVAVPGAPGPDLLDPGRGVVVPQTWHTDGHWVWSGSVIYYLLVHGLAPQPELLEHLRRQRYVVPPVDEDAVARAVAAVNGTPIPAPRPAPDDEPPVERRPDRGDPPDSPELTAALRRATEAAEEMGIDPERYCVDGERDNAWCLDRDGERWLVFQRHGQSRKGNDFETVHEAVDFFVGHLYLRRAEFRRAADHDRDSSGTPAAHEGHSAGDQSAEVERSRHSREMPSEAANAEAESPSTSRAPSTAGSVSAA